MRITNSDVFYAFTLAVTVISLIITVLIAAMSRVKRKVPPGEQNALLPLLFDGHCNTLPRRARALSSPTVRFPT